MTGKHDPWQAIEAPKEDHSLNVRRGDTEHPLDYWFARDILGRYVFCFDADADVPNLSTLPRLAGIEIVALRMSDTGCRLALTLLDSEQFDIFRALCTDLMRATEQLTRNESAIGLKITLNRLMRWQSLLEKAHNDMLSRSETIGLVGELLVLRDLLLPRLGALDAVQSWRGPFGDEQDFLLVQKMVEVKTQLSTSDRYLAIGSEEQLDTTSGPIIVCHQTLDVPASEDSGASSLNDLVFSVSELMEVAGHAASDLFQSALLEAGYRRREEYGRPYWLLNVRSFYEVREGFPRIVPSMIGFGIDRVRYRIALQACQDFKIDEEKAMEWVLNEQ